MIIFDSTHQALRGEKVLKEAHLPLEVVSTPQQFKSGCGISLRVRPEKLERAVELLDTASVVYSRVEPYYCSWLE